MTSPRAPRSAVRADRVTAHLYRDTLAVTDDVDAVTRIVRHHRAARRQTRTILRTATLTGANQ